MSLTEHLRGFLRGPRRSEAFALPLDYPLHPRPRWGYEVPLSRRIVERLERGRGRYEAILRAFRRHLPAFLDIPRLPPETEPEPRSGIDRLCDRVIRQPLEEADLELFDVVLPNNTFITRDPELSGLLEPLWELPVFAGAELHGESFWIRARGSA